jgi:hypothetical protein
MTSPLEVVALVPVGVVSVLGIAYSLVKAGSIAFKTLQEGRLVGAQARRERAVADATEIENDLRRTIVKSAIRRYLESEGASLQADAQTSRLFDNTLEQLIENVDGLRREAVTGLELPGGAAALVEFAFAPDAAESDDAGDTA